MRGGKTCLLVSLARPGKGGVAPEADGPDVLGLEVPRPISSYPIQLHTQYITSSTRESEIDLPASPFSMRQAQPFPWLHVGMECMLTATILTTLSFIAESERDSRPAAAPRKRGGPRPSVLRAFPSVRCVGCKPHSGVELAEQLQVWTSWTPQLSLIPNED